MKKKIKYSDEKIGEVEIVKDFLPKPEDLVFKEDTVKVTLNLSRSSVEFFKKVARATWQSVSESDQEFTGQVHFTFFLITNSAYPFDIFLRCSAAIC